MQNQNARTREIEERLVRVESPEPPADLLDRIQADIPAHLAPPAAGGAGARRGLRLLAASLAVAALGGLVAWRVLERAPDPAEQVERQLARAPEAPDAPEAAEASPPASVEVGPESRPAAPDDGKAPAEAPAATDPAPAAAADSRVQDETAGRDLEDRNEYRVRRRDESAPAAPTTIEVGAPAPPEVELEGRLGGREVTAETAPPAPPQPAPVEPPRESRLGELDAVGETEERIVVMADEEAPRARSPRAQALKQGRTEVGIAPPAPAPVPAPSTGGTAEPNDRAYGDMFFRSYGTNPFVDTEDDRLSTFGLDVDTGSYTLARSYLERGTLPPPEAIRVEEFVNYFDYRDPAPRRGEFTLTVEGAPSPWARGPRYHLLRIGIKGREISAARRREATLVFVVDVSGSMARENRIGLVKRALHLLLDELGPGDQVGLVVYGSHGRVLLEPSHDLEQVRRAVDRLATGGSTNAEEGLVLAYDLARRYWRPEGINRIILCSDGVANVGRTGPESILERIGREADEGIELTTVGFGMGNYNDVLMEQLADQGDGNYAYVDTLDEARRVFVEELSGTLETIAADAKVQVELDPRMVSRYRLLGYENRDVADHRFRDDSIDAGEIGAGHAVSALYEIKLVEGAPRRGRIGEVRLRYRSRATGRVVEDALEIRRSRLAGNWRTAPPGLKLAAVAAELAEVLKGSYWAREANLEELVRRAEAAERHFPGDPDVRELVDLVRRVGREPDWRERWEE